MAVDELPEVERLERQKKCIVRVRELIDITIANQTFENLEVLYKYLMSDCYDVLLEYEALRQLCYNDCMRLIRKYEGSPSIDTMKEFQGFIDRSFQR